MALKDKINQWFGDQNTPLNRFVFAMACVFVAGLFTAIAGATVNCVPVISAGGITCFAAAIVSVIVTEISRHGKR